MSEAGAAGVNGAWKWLAAIIAAVMIGGLPGYVDLYLNHPTQSEIRLLRGRQDAVLQQLVGIELRLEQLKEDLHELEQGGVGK